MLLSPIPFATTSETSIRQCGTVASSKLPEGSKQRSRPNLMKICQKTKMCSFYLRGACRRDTNCTFAHDPSEIQSKPDLSGTKMCPALLQTGQCPRMASCKFAHHEDELRQIDHSTTIFPSTYEERPETAELVGATTNALASLTAEQAWVDADLNSDSRMGVETFSSRCSLPLEVSPSSVRTVSSSSSLTSHALRTKDKRELRCRVSSAASTVDSDLSSQSSSEESDGSTGRPKDLAMHHISVKNTFVHFQTGDLNTVHMRSRSVPCPHGRRNM